jgi:hypothetical protein
MFANVGSEISGEASAIHPSATVYAFNARLVEHVIGALITSLALGILPDARTIEILRFSISGARTTEAFGKRIADKTRLAFASGTQHVGKPVGPSVTNGNDVDHGAAV